jgi:hypothetical protein
VGLVAACHIARICRALTCARNCINFEFPVRIIVLIHNNLTIAVDFRIMNYAMASHLAALNNKPDIHDDEEVQFLGETYEGDEVAVIENSHENSADSSSSLSKKEDSAEKPVKVEFVRQGYFRFMDLPAELRTYIYSFFLPNKLVITHFKHNYSGNAPFMYDIEVLTKDGELAPLKMGKQGRRDWRNARRHPPPGTVTSSVETNLFRVNKLVSNEARGRSPSLHIFEQRKLNCPAMLYGSNVYEFCINSAVHHPTSLRSLNIFGPFGDDTRLPTLRNLRSICIDFVMNSNAHWAVKRQRARLDFFVEILKEHADDENRKSLLQELRVNVRGVADNAYSPPLEPDVETFMFSLESLAALRGIKDVNITGVPEWFAQCLQVCIQGKGGEVQETDWPLVQVKRLKLSAEQRVIRYDWERKKIKKAWVSTRKWYQPVYNWKEYAERNGITVPDNIDDFWAV